MVTTVTSSERISESRVSFNPIEFILQTSEVRIGLGIFIQEE